MKVPSSPGRPIRRRTPKAAPALLAVRNRQILAQLRTRSVRQVARDFIPFKMTIIADGPRIATWVNGYQTIDFLDERPEHANWQAIGWG